VSPCRSHTSKVPFHLNHHTELDVENISLSHMQMPMKGHSTRACIDASSMEGKQEDPVHDPALQPQSRSLVPWSQTPAPVMEGAEQDPPLQQQPQSTLAPRSQTPTPVVTGNGLLGIIYYVIIVFMSTPIFLIFFKGVAGWKSQTRHRGGGLAGGRDFFLDLCISTVLPNAMKPK